MRRTMGEEWGLSWRRRCLGATVAEIGGKSSAVGGADVCWSFNGDGTIRVSAVFVVLVKRMDVFSFYCT